MDTTRRGFLAAMAGFCALRGLPGVVVEGDTVAAGEEAPEDLQCRFNEEDWEFERDQTVRNTANLQDVDLFVVDSGGKFSPPIRVKQLQADSVLEYRRYRHRKTGKLGVLATKPAEVTVEGREATGDGELLPSDVANPRNIYVMDSKGNGLLRLGYCILTEISLSSHGEVGKHEIHHFALTALELYVDVLDSRVNGFLGEVYKGEVYPKE